MSGELEVLIVDDHAAMRRGLELLLRGRGLRVVGAASSAQEGVRLFGARRPDVSVVDLALRDGSGAEVAAAILAADPSAGVLLYTGLSDAEAVAAGARTGARGLAHKTGGPDELVAAIRTVGAGGVHVDATVAALLAGRDVPAPVLTDREREVLGLLADGLSGRRIAQRLVLSPETVRTHIRNATVKLGASTRVHAVALALARGELRR